MLLFSYNKTILKLTGVVSKITEISMNLSSNVYKDLNTSGPRTKRYENKKKIITLKKIYIRSPELSSVEPVRWVITWKHRFTQSKIYLLGVT